MKDMQREGIPARDEALSTEDIAHPQEASRDETAARPDDVPLMPGEATAEEPVGAAPEAAPAVEQAEGGTAEAAVPPKAEEPAEETGPLLGREADEFHSRWQEIQSGFVDDPREAVHAADALVADVMQTLATSFAEHKQGLEEQWQRGEEVATEDLRVALRRYRSFFNRLLST
ncbi:hypothetical protein [Streptomyces sp. KR80]|uniref:hypothetical protein n=1 Tax=Streptomyces sp. KR80 TaxID=3457426 RepID=UPI003FD1F012